MNKVFTIFIASFLLAILLSPPVISFAQQVSNDQLNQAQIQKAQLEAELVQLEAEINQKQQLLQGQKNQSGSLKNDISILKTKISSAKLSIQAKGLIISKLSQEINQKKQTINVLSDKIEQQKESLAQLMRKTNEIDNASVVHVILSSQDVSEFYQDIDSFAVLNKSIKLSVDGIRGVKSETEIEKKTLEEKQDAELDAKMALESAKREVEKNESAKNKLLSISQQKEKEYQAVLTERQRKAAQIRTALFSLAGGTTAIQFGDALRYANFASQKTGVSPAFLLAILTQETNLGANQGRCYLTVPETGEGSRVDKNGNVVESNVKNVMKPSRDVSPFLTITKSLGRDPYRTIVSCPLGGVGYGGAMGPSQFIPSTWDMLKKRIANAVGKSVADPWNPQDAFMASAIYLSDLGASSSSYSAQRNAACRYYSGRICDSKKPANTFYGNSVMNLATSIQENKIDPLQGI